MESAAAGSTHKLAIVMPAKRGELAKGLAPFDRYSGVHCDDLLYDLRVALPDARVQHNLRARRPN